MDVLLELDYTPEFLQSCNFDVELLAYELADYRHVGFYADGEDFDINAYVFIDRVWTFGMYASDEKVYFMFYNGLLVREFFNYELEGYAGQAIRCCDLYISIQHPLYYIHVKNYRLFISINTHNTKTLREAVKSNKIPDIFYRFDNLARLSREDVEKYITGTISRRDDVSYIKDIIIYEDVLPDSQLEKHDFRFELIED